MNIRIIIILCLGLSLLSSCVSYDSLLNYEEAPEVPSEPQTISNYKPIRIQTNDILSIKVNSVDPVAAAPFALDGGVGANANNTQVLLLNGYLVDDEGYIDFPTIGSLKLGGLTMKQAKQEVLTKLQPYFETLPIVNIRLLNFNIHINGEVGAPGLINVMNQRITIVEAMTLAGDFTDYSQRDSILIIRELDGERSFGYIDFNSPDLFNSPYFYLQQNDVIYVRPLPRRRFAVADPITRVFSIVSGATGIVAFVISVLNRN